MCADHGRRSFLRGAAAGAAALAAKPAPIGADPAGRTAFTAADPGPAPAGAAVDAPVRSARLKLSCNLYSFNAPLRSGAMSLEQVIDFCADLGFDGVDPTGYYFPGYPEPPRDEYLHAIARRAFRNGLGISGTGVRNDFTLPDATKRAAEAAHVRRWIEVAATLGAPCLRVFDGRAEAKEPSRAQMTDWVVEGFRECAAHGERHGVTVVYQNHDELLKTAAEVLAVRERVSSDWFGLNVDIGSLRTGDPYEEVARLAPYACTWQLKELVYRNGREEKTDVRRAVGILRGAGYRGYVPIETLGDGDPREKVRRFLGEVREAIGGAG
jgi:sugar phosphate isomerase/epimerase